MLENRKVGKDIIDKGWNELSAILDAEMPTGDSSRRGIFIWFLGFLLMGVVGLGLWWSLSANGDLDRIDNLPEQIFNSTPSIAVKESKVESKPLNQADENLSKNTNEDLLQTASPVTIETDHNKTTSDDQSQQSIQPSEVKEEVEAEYVGATKEDDNNIENTILEKSDESIISKEDDPVQVDISEPVNAPRTMLAVNALPLQGDRIKWDYAFNNELSIKPLEDQSLNGWMAYVNSRVIEYEHFNVELGLGYEWSLTSGFSVVPQIGYGWDKIIYTSAAVPERAVEFSSVNGLNADSFVSALSNRTKEHFISMGMDAIYNLNHRWQIYTGINYRLLTESLGVGADELDLLDNSSDPSEEQASGIASIDVNHDVYLRIGIGRRITRDLSLGAYYYMQVNDPYDIIVNGLKDGEATSRFFPRRKAMNVFLNYRF